MSKGVIYILTNPSFPHYVKISYANDLSQRLRQLNRSEALSYAFRAFAVYDVDHRLTDTSPSSKRLPKKRVQRTNSIGLPPRASR